MLRILFTNSEEQERAEAILDECGIMYDYDAGDRMMVEDEDVPNILSDSDIDFDIV